jgi:hypothetical protein
MLSSTRWTSTHVGPTSAAPFALRGLNAVAPGDAKNPPQLQALWDEFLKDFDKYYNTVSPAARQAILKAYQSWQDYFEGTLGGQAGWSMSTTAPNMAPWIAVLAQAQGVLDNEKARGAQAQAVTNQAATRPVTQLKEESVFANRALSVGLVGIAALILLLGASNE